MVKTNEDNKKYSMEEALIKAVPFYDVFDLDRKYAFTTLCLFRLFCTLTFTKMLINPDELY